jgi:hypothetical protein
MLPSIYLIQRRNLCFDLYQEPNKALLSFAPTPLSGLRLRSTYQGRWSRLRFSGRKRYCAFFLAMLAAQQPALAFEYKDNPK